jgi:hypothetical protein
MNHPNIKLSFGKIGENSMKSLSFQITFLLVVALFINFASDCFSAVDPNIVLWLPFDEGTGTVAKDSSSYKNDGAITGAKWVAGKYGSALSFDGISNVVEVKSTNDLQLSDQGLTIALWFKTAEKAKADLLLIEKGAWDTGEYGLSYPGYANLKVRFQIYEVFGQQSNQIDSTSGSPALSDDQWHHVAGVYDAVNHTFKVYVDGKVETQQGAAAHKFTSDTQSIFIGSRNKAGNWFVGAIDDLVIAKVPFTDAQIKSQMAGNLVVSAVASAGKLATEWGNIKRD